MTNELKKSTLAKDTHKEIVTQTNPIVNFNAENLISQAIEKGLPVDTMERLLVMRRELKAEWAKEQFTKSMSAFQAECPTIQKTKEVVSNGKLLYKYAPIESIVAQVKEYLKRHGFSYSTTMEVLNDGVKACVKVVHIDGHSEESCMQVPLGNKTQIMSASQQTAAAQTFAKRYAFCNAFGILTGDDDNDGATISEKPSPSAPVDENLYLRLSAMIQDASTPAGLDLIATDVKLAFQNKKITAKDLGLLSAASVAKRKTL